MEKYKAYKAIKVEKKSSGTEGLKKNERRKVRDTGRPMFRRKIAGMWDATSQATKHIVRRERERTSL